jgi:hypothetical protein
MIRGSHEHPLVNLAVCLTLRTVARDSRFERGWTDYRNERFGFSLRYPGDVFEPEKASEAGDGQVFISRDGTARLLVGALPNDTGQGPAAYLDYIARVSYAGYRIDYRRLAGSWFVLSGEGNGKTFYEKVMFSCAGRLINSFAMIYPTDQRGLFDPIVEGMEASFRPARECGRRAAASLAIPPPRHIADMESGLRSTGPRSAMADCAAEPRRHRPCGVRVHPTITRSCAGMRRAKLLSNGQIVGVLAIIALCHHR